MFFGIDSLTIFKKRGRKMSYYDEGYNKGYEDGFAGKPSERESPAGLLDFINDQNVTEWEEGYEAGYKDGEKERRGY